ncbi:MAG TPA: AbrB/MazE/SpoVT family DNA-binding domain-containing protein [Rhizobium sp.]
MKQVVRRGPHEVEIGHDEEGQFIPVPEDMELSGSVVTIWKVGDRLIVEPVAAKNLAEVLSGMEALPPEDQFPDID